MPQAPLPPSSKMFQGLPHLALASPEFAFVLMLFAPKACQPVCYFFSETQFANPTSSSGPDCVTLKPADASSAMRNSS
jgi:hypothetical protein